MLTLFDRLYPASYKGISFFYATGSKTHGRKKVLHEYPGKDFDFVEDLGKKLREFKITAVISGTLTYEINRQQFESALLDSSVGILIHPFYGVVNCVVMGDWTVTEEPTNIGSAVYEITFRENQPNVYPTPATNNFTNIITTFNTVYDTVISDLGVNYIIEYYNNINYISQKMTNITNQFNAYSKNTSSPNQVDLNNFTKASSDYSANIYSIVSSPTDFADYTVNLVQTFDAISDSEQDRFNMNYNMFGIGENDIPVPQTTESLIERENDRILINGCLNVLFLANMYFSATQLTITNENELTNINTKTETAYSYLFSDPTNIYMSTDLVNAIQELRVNVKSFFDNESLTINKITSINAKNIPVNVLTYQYYGSLDNASDIISLNSITNASLISGNIKILTS